MREDDSWPPYGITQAQLDAGLEQLMALTTEDDRGHYIELATDPVNVVLEVYRVMSGTS